MDEIYESMNWSRKVNFYDGGSESVDVVEPLFVILNNFWFQKNKKNLQEFTKFTQKRRNFNFLLFSQKKKKN